MIAFGGAGGCKDELSEGIAEAEPGATMVFIAGEVEAWWKGVRNKDGKVTNKA